MKIILLLLLLGFACAAAMMLIHRLNRITAQLGDLKRESVRKDDELNRQLASLKAEPKSSDGTIQN